MLKEQRHLDRIRAIRQNPDVLKTLPEQFIEDGYGNDGWLRDEARKLKISDARMDLDEFVSLNALEGLKGKVPAHKLNGSLNPQRIDELKPKLRQYHDVLNSCWVFNENNEVRTNLLKELKDCGAAAF
jgi:hypothetical protein